MSNQQKKTRGSFVFGLIIFGLMGLVVSTQSSAEEIDLDRRILELFQDHEIKPLELYKTHNQALVVLGEKLFSDNRLSGNKNISCQSCHHPEHGAGDGLPLSVGEGGEGIGPRRQMGSGQIIPRHAPALWNLAKANVLFWDGRVSWDPIKKVLLTPEPQLNGQNPALKEYAGQLNSALAAQAMFPPTSHAEMLGTPGSNEVSAKKSNQEIWEALTARVTSDDNYQDLLNRAFPTTPLHKINFAHLAQALAEFQSVTFQAISTPLDRYLRGERSAMTEAEKRGALFFLTKGKCVQCHLGPQLSDFRFHVIAFPQLGPGKDESHDDLGRMMVTGDFKDRYAFRTPPLRNIIKTAPWGHSGAFTDLREMILHYHNPMRTFRFYTPAQEGLPYRLEHERTKNPDRWQSLDARVRTGFVMNQQDFSDLHDFLMHALTE